MQLPLDKTRRGRVLIVDDDRMIREVTSEVVRQSGYDVKLAASGAEGTRMLMREPSVFHCVLLDWSMPDEKGECVLASMRRVAPDVPIIVMSGYDQTSVFIEDQPATRFLGKPFTGDQLIQAIRATALCQ